MKTADKVQIKWVSNFLLFLIIPCVLNYYDVIAISFIMWAAYFNATMDIVSHKYEQSLYALYNKPQYYNPLVSWVNKYKKDGGIITTKRKKFLGITIPSYFTDFWHRQKIMMIFSYSLLACSSIYYSPIIQWYYYLAILLIIYGIVFEFYYWLLKQKD